MNKVEAIFFIMSWGSNVEALGPFDTEKTCWKYAKYVMVTPPAPDYLVRCVPESELRWYNVRIHYRSS